MKTKLWIILLLMGAQSYGQSISPFDQFFAGTEPKKMQDVSYDYRLVLLNVKTMQKNDSMFGHLAYSEKRFVDSNTLFFTAKNGKQYCKLDHTAKTAILLDLDQLSDQINMPISDEPNNAIAITEAFLKNKENKMEYDYTNPLFYRLIITPKDQLLHYAAIDFLKSNNALLAAHFEIDEIDQQQNTWYRAVYDIYNVQNKVNENIFDLTRIFSMVNGSARLNKKMADYKRIKII